MDIKRIAVVGTGLMGKGIAHFFAISGYRVDLFGRRDDVEKEFSAYLDNEVKRERITPGERENILNNLKIFNLNSQASELSNSDLIIETVKEDFETKKEIFEIINKYISRQTIVASNTSSYSITNMAEFISFQEDFIGMHFFSPVPLMKLVEVVRGEKTSPNVITCVKKLIENTGKLPVVVKDGPGFVLNRGLALLINEAAQMYCEKITDSAEDIDNIFINGMNLKVGPLKLADLIGIDVCYATMMNLYEGFGNQKYKPCSLIVKMVEEGKLGKKKKEGFYKY